MPGARLRLYPKQLQREIRQESLPGRQKVAGQIATAARAAAPVLTGEYRDGISVETAGLIVRVTDSDVTSIHKEYGTSKTPAHAALTNAAMAHGRYSGMTPR